MNYLGIDPGKLGGIAVLFETGETYVLPYSTQALLDTCRQIQYLRPRCCLEKVHAMPKQGVASTFTFGAGWGFIKGVLEAYGISYQEVPPEKWKKEFGLMKKDKKASVAICRQLFPQANLRPSDRSRVDSDGMAEALLMAEYARRKL